jgi:hypothetical protein
VKIMIASSQFIVCVLVCSVALTSAGCTSMKTVRPVTQPGVGAVFGTVKAGDLVDLRTVDGRTARFIVQQVEVEAIVAPDGVRYTHAEIAELKKRSFSGPKTAGLIAGICGGLFLLAGLAVASALGSFWG